MSTSKTSAGSSIAETLRAYWKRFAASATASAHRYRFDIFYRTGWNVVLLQIGFTVLLLLLVFLSLSLLYEDVLQNLISSITDSLQSGALPTPEDAAQAARDLEYAKQKNMLYAGTGILMLAALFGWLITRLALVPTRKALESQKQFVGNIAHEIRTPLAILKTNTEVALCDQHLTTDLRETLVSNVEELDRISSIVNNLLSLSRLLRPEKIDFKNVDLKECVDSVLNTLEDLIAHKEAIMELRIAKERTIWGNASAIEQMLINIIKNAMHYSPHGSRIIVSAGPTLDGHVVLSIADNGPGIAEKDLAHIFEPYYRGDTARNRKGGAGSGLGLAIVSELVKVHKGRIGIKSTLGKGTTVSLFFPKGRFATKPKAAENAQSEVGMDFSS